MAKISSFSVIISFLICTTQFKLLLSINPKLMSSILQPVKTITEEILQIKSACGETDTEIVLGTEDFILEFFVCLNPNVIVMLKLNYLVPEVQIENLISFWGNISQVTNMSFSYEHKKVVAILIPRNGETFFEVLHQVRKTFSTPSQDWRPYWFICYPKEIDSLEQDKLTMKLLDDFSLENSSFPLDSDIYIIFNYFGESRNTNRNLSMWELYSVKNHSILSEIPLDGSAKSDILVNLSLKTIRRSNFHQVDIIGAAGYELDYQFETEFENNTNTTFKSGLAVSLYKDLKFTLNFSELAMPGEWMIRNTSDSIDWLVLDGKADIAISQSTLTLDTRPDTENLLSYLQPTSSARLFAILVQPPASTIRNIFITPFSSGLWLVLATSLLIIIVSTVSISEIKLKAGHWDPGMELISQQATVWVLGTLCQQGYWHQAPISLSMKVLFMTASTAGMICYIAYSAAIVSTLSTRVVPIRDVDDLRNSSLKIFGDENDKLGGYIFEGKVNVSDTRSIILPEDALTVLTKTSSAYLGFTDSFVAAARRLNNTERLLCNKFSYIPFSRVEYKSSMFIKKGSPYREFFNNKIILIKERGLNDLYMKTYNRLANLRCSPSPTTEKKSLGMNDLFTSFAILVSAYILCTAILFFEKIGLSSSPTNFSIRPFSAENEDEISMDKIVTSANTQMSIFTLGSESSSRSQSSVRRGSV